MPYANILTHCDDRVGIITLNRPKVLNALSRALIEELGEAIKTFDANPEIGAIVITGNDKAFAAGADISEMAAKSAIDMYAADHFGGWSLLESCRCPLIAAVSGYALGGGCELALACDVIIASDSARFGQPEINLGVLPGLGATQRLPRLVGKAKAMDLCLTGRLMHADEAERAGLVSRIVPAAQLPAEALALAKTIAAMPRTAVRMIKQAINHADDSGLTAGLCFERNLFSTAFASEDQSEGMAAFIEKRPPAWRHR